MPDTKTIELRAPVSLGSETFDRLDLREPTAAEVVKAQREGAINGASASDILLISIVSGVPKPAVEKIGIRDVQEAARFLSGFMKQPPTDGEA